MTDDLRFIQAADAIEAAQRTWASSPELRRYYADDQADYLQDEAARIFSQAQMRDQGAEK